MKTFATVAIVLLFALSLSMAAQTVDQVAVDIRELFKTLRYPGLTVLEQQALIGTRYYGVMRISSVERDAKGTVWLNSRFTVNNGEQDTLYAGIASFEMKDAKRAATLTWGYKVRLSGRLARIYKPDPNDVRGRTEFIDVIIDDVLGPSPIDQ
jgi:hypothetical protein